MEKEENTDPVPEQKTQEKQEKKGQDIEDLPGIGSATAEKLKESGYSEILNIAVASPGQLCDATGINEASARKVIQAARSMMEMGFESGTDLLERRKKVIKITTGSTAVDEILGGGFETGSIIEAYGAYGSSKTQIAHQLAVNAQLPISKKGAEGTVVYIDTENTFRPERIIQFAEGMGIDSKKALENIKVAKAFNSDHQMLLAEKIEELINKSLNVKLVIIDSLTAHFRAEFIGRGTLAERQQKINRHMKVLSKLADMHNLCVYVTNQVMAKPDTFFGDPTEAIGGHIVGHNSAFRIYLRRGKKGTRVAKLVDSPNLPENEATFNITEGGIKDV
ncbi:MAG: DNA repair and recombination protein RadA [Candidatus Woesearchaeota archaeon]|jgi:DNA repair protein RadA|nr:DNA repair and recombination protein RadA [Candidatus Woesearchaeota archaeon]MDP7610225.1 DNA repair and recombination protein RadA [Candidatus Woesearchaeota archaeon]|tara:strand:+ start:12156 stop:13160 length:1005 start_codon:yes stop_codon:yes gene_type:complete